MPRRRFSPRSGAELNDARARGVGRGAAACALWLGRDQPRAAPARASVTFHLAENKRSPETPFAFMATYTHRLSAQEKPVAPAARARACRNTPATKNQGGAAFAARTRCGQAAESSAVDARAARVAAASFSRRHGHRPQAHAFLREVPVLEESGIVAASRTGGKSGRGPRPKVSVQRGRKPRRRSRRRCHAERFPCADHARRRTADRRRMANADAGAGRARFLAWPVGRGGSREARRRARSLEKRRKRARRAKAFRFSRRCGCWPAFGSARAADENAGAEDGGLERSRAPAAGCGKRWSSLRAAGRRGGI